MLMLSDLCFSKELWSVGCDSAGCDSSNEWSFGGPENNWSVKLPVVSTLDFTK